MTLTFFHEYSFFYVLDTLAILGIHMQRRKRTYNIANTSLKRWQILMTLAKHLAKRISIHDVAEALQKVWIYLSSCIHVLNAFVNCDVANEYATSTIFGQGRDERPSTLTQLFSLTNLQKA